MTSDYQHDDGPTEPARGIGLGTLPLRLAIAYTFLYMLPFPLSALGALDAIPGVENSFVSRAIGSLVGLHEKLTAPIVAAIGRYLTGQEISMEVTGSSDTLACYCDFLLDVGLALVLTLLWWAWRRSQPVSPQVIEVNRVLVRYLLFVVLVSYGVVKIFPGGQFGMLTPTRLLSTYGDSSPMGLLWTFMGASTAYSMLGGGLELVGGMLLLFRRTTLLGSLVLAGVMANVFALNLCYDVPVKLFSFHLLGLSLFLAAPDAGRLYAVLVANKAVPRRDLGPPWDLSPRVKRALLVLKFAYVVLYLSQAIGGSWDSYQAHREELEHPLRGIYRVESFAVENASGSGEDLRRWVRVGLTPPYSAKLLYSDGSASTMRLRLDMEASTLAMFERGTAEPEHPMRFERAPDGLLKLEGDFQGRQISVQLRPEKQESLLISRGFHWVTQLPLNR